MKSNQFVLISGGASGLGAATADLLRQSGAIVGILDQQVQASANSIACDITDEHQVKTAIDTMIKNCGIPRVCINCAGIAPAKRLVGKHGAMPLSDFQHVINVNLIGTFNVMRFVAEKMCQLDPMGEDKERGVIINTASIAAYEGQIGQTAYSASKGAVVSMTLTAARELAQFGIRVMTIAPGIMDTPMMAKMSDETKQPLLRQIPFPQRLGHAKEFAMLAQHIIENNYLNGSVIRLDGGLRMA
jgi:NAD(P)-dependent dehydrogenase (short-subunit alcohol dehydrogenase family)